MKIDLTEWDIMAGLQPATKTSSYKAASTLRKCSSRIGVKKKMDVIVIEQFDYKTFSNFLEYLYTEKLMYCHFVINWQELHRLADYYGHPDLKARCKKM